MWAPRTYPQEGSERDPPGRGQDSVGSEEIRFPRKISGYSHKEGWVSNSFLYGDWTGVYRRGRHPSSHAPHREDAGGSLLSKSGLSKITPNLPSIFYFPHASRQTGS